MQLEQIFKDNRRFLWGLSYRMTGSTADADDVLQETFVRLMQKPPERTDEPMRPWLVRVAGAGGRAGTPHLHGGRGCRSRTRLPGGVNYPIT